MNQLQPGTHVALVGHSGCGKSTLVSLLLRYYDQEKGKVSLYFSILSIKYGKYSGNNRRN